MCILVNNQSSSNYTVKFTKGHNLFHKSTNNILFSPWLSELLCKSKTNGNDFYHKIIKQEKGFRNSMGLNCTSLQGSFSSSIALFKYHSSYKAHILFSLVSFHSSPRDIPSDNAVLSRRPETHGKVLQKPSLHTEFQHLDHLLGQ